MRGLYSCFLCPDRVVPIWTLLAFIPTPPRATWIERNKRLIQAVKTGDIEQVQRVLTVGAVVNARTSAGLNRA